jgi:hypothetical protein
MYTAHATDSGFERTDPSVYAVMCTSYGDLFENLTLRRTLRQFSLFLKFTVTST